MRVDARPIGEIAVFAKVPHPGAVKTRLIPLLGELGAAQLHARLVRGALDTARAVECASTILWLTGDFGEWSPPEGQRWEIQRGEDLGERMANAFLIALARSPAVVLIGSDCPALRPAHIDAAFVALETHDVAIVPAEDGGYVLIGLARPQPRLFEGIEWGESSVMEATRTRIDALGLRVALLPTLPDLDTPSDLERALREGWIV